MPNNNNTEETAMEIQTADVPPTAPFYRPPQNHAETFWTADLDNELKRLYATGASATAIQKEIGASSRGMVCGRIDRLGLTRDTGYEVDAARNKKHKEAMAEQRRARSVRAKGGSVQAVRLGKTTFKAIDFRRAGPDGLVGALVAIDRMVPRDVPDVPVAQRKTLLALTNTTCRWPYNDPCEPGFYFCGDPSADLIGGRPYCPTHQIISEPAKTNP